jgi:hypothetical protein
VRADPDYTAYVVARWSPAFRSLVVLGVPEERAEDLAVGVFARLLPEWARLRREGDVDVEMGRLLLDSWARDRGNVRTTREPAPVPAGRVLTQELEEQLALLARLTDGLVGCEEPTRLAVVLRHVAELDVQQVADVLHQPPGEVGRRLSDAAHALDLVPLDPACHHAGHAIDVPMAPVDRVVATVSTGRRRLALAAGAVLAVLVLVAGVAFVATRPDPPADAPLDALDVTKVGNPVGVVWWLDGTLHLHGVTAEVPDVVQLADAGLGVAYADSEGSLVWVTEDGDRERLGSMDLGTALLAQPQTGKLAWLEPDGGDLVVWNAATRHVQARVPRTADTWLIGWDRDRLYFSQDGRDQQMTFVDVDHPAVADVAPPEDLAASRIVDVAAGVELRRQDGVLSVTLPFFSVTSEVPGENGALSTDGNWVLAVDGDGVPTAYDARNGAQQGPWYDPSWSAVGATFTRDGRVVWVVDEHNGSYGLVDCQVPEDVNRAFDPDAQHCEPQLDVGAVPILADVRPGLVADAS